MALLDGLVIDAGFLGIAGFGVWRGQSLWSRHIELKHEREMERLGMDRMEKSIRLEMEQTRNLAEMEMLSKSDQLALPEAGMSTASLDALPWLCNCGMQNGCWHVHALHRGMDTTFALSVGAVGAISEGNLDELCICDKHMSNVIHTATDPARNLYVAGILLRDARV